MTRVNADNTKLIRQSRILRQICAGRPALMVKSNFTDPRVVEIACASGFDALWTCMEHVADTYEQVENKVRAAKIYDVDTVVRVSRGSYSDLIRPLEIDAAGIMVPHVTTADEAEEIVNQVKFQPFGRRAIDGASADAAYGRVSKDDYTRIVNSQRLLIIQIEDPETMPHLDAIAKTPGVDMLFFGPQDYAHGLGSVGDINRTEIHEARAAVVESARKYGKLAGTTGTPKKLSQLIGMGYQLINIGSATNALREHFDRVANDAAKAISFTHNARKSQVEKAFS